MKKLSVLLFFLVATTCVVFGQEFKKFRLALGAGIASPVYTKEVDIVDLYGGLSLSIEPSYRLSDKLALGLKLETSLLTSKVFTFIVTNSVSFNGQYYWKSGTGVRPFIGAGVGSYAYEIIYRDSKYDYLRKKDATSIAFYPRVGFDMGHFTLNLDYNFLPNNKYFTVRAALQIGGGKKD